MVTSRNCLGECDLGEAGRAAQLSEPRPEALGRLRACLAHGSASSQGAPILTRRDASSVRDHLTGYTLYV